MKRRIPQGNFPKYALGCCIVCLVLLSAVLALTGLLLPEWMTGRDTITQDPFNNAAIAPTAVDVNYGLLTRCQKGVCVSWPDVLDKNPCDDIGSARIAVAVLTGLGLSFSVLSACCLACGSYFHWVVACVGGCFLLLSFLMEISALITFPTTFLSGDINCTGLTNGGGLCPDCQLGAAWYLVLVAALLLLLSMCLSCCLCFLARNKRKPVHIVPPAQPLFAQPLPAPSPISALPVIPGPTPFGGGHTPVAGDYQFHNISAAGTGISGPQYVCGTPMCNDPVGSGGPVYLGSY